MRLIIMRHGEAEAPRVDDFSRPLTSHGRGEVRRNAAKLLTQLKKPVRLLASPLVRAQQTAEILAEGLGLSEYRSLDCLTPAGQPDAVINQLQAALALEDCLIVSHQPLVSELIYHLSHTDVQMGTATIVCLSFEVLAPKCSEVEWCIHA